MNAGGHSSKYTKAHKQFCTCAQPQSLLKAPEPVHVHIYASYIDSWRTQSYSTQEYFTPVTVGVEMNLAEHIFENLKTLD